MADAPIDLKCNVDLRLGPSTKEVPAELRGKPVASCSLVWTGAPEAADRYLRPILSLCHQDSVSSSVVPYLHLQTMADSCFPHGQRYYTKSGYFSYLDDVTINRLLEAVGSLPSTDTLIEFAYLGGTASQVHAGDTAFGDRSAPFIMNVLANWSQGSSDDEYVSWVRGLFHRLRPAMKPGVYVNFMSGDEQDRVPEAYRERWERMVSVKTHYDPRNFFRLNQNVPPQTRDYRSS